LVLDATSRVVIVGGGQAGIETAASLRQNGFEGSVTVVCDETDLPYQRPPLSKDFLKSDGTSPLPIKAEAFYDANRIALLRGVTASAIDRSTAELVLQDGGRLSYDHLVLATGARNRIPPIPGLESADVLELRTLAHARALMSRFGLLRRVTVLGGGFIGLEVASLLRGMDVAVTVVEMSDRLMGRVLSPAMSEWFGRFHEGLGVDLRFGVRAERVEGSTDGSTVVLSDGTAVETDAIVLAVGVLPNQELAADAGLAVDNGIVVDDRLLTADPHISAIGDCAAHPNPFGLGMVRLESVQNAIDQARCVAARLTGTDEPYASLPWFWSNQATARLQIAGLAAGVDQAVTRGDPGEGKFSEFLYRGGRLVCVESVSAPADHMAARRILAGGVTVPPEQASDPATNLKDFMPR
jgi:3-phenylpropionate/trans-cinnamate dioxygenase ferredoxin reductase component